MNFDDLEFLLEGLLDGLKARKQIEPLRQKLSELAATNAALTAERDKLRKENSSLRARLDELSEARDDFQRQLNEQQAKFDWEFAEVCNELSEAKETSRKQLTDAQADFDKRLDDARKISRQQLADARDDFQRELREHHNEFDREMSAVCNELSEANEARRKAETEADFYRATYGELDGAYKAYSSLDESTRSDLAGIFGTGNSLEAFFGGAVQESHLPTLWDYVSRHVDDMRLAKLFDFCFAAVNRGFREPPYIRLKTERGNFFDNETMRRTYRSRQNGRVVRVLLCGYRHSSGNVVRQSLVELA